MHSSVARNEAPRLHRWVTRAVLLGALLALPNSLAALGNVFTYQGRLERAGSAFNSTCDLTFDVYDQALGGGQLGQSYTANGVPVQDGLFSVAVNAGANVFTGGERYLQVTVRCGGDSAPVALSPRQHLTASPYALYAAATASLSCTGCVTSNQIAAGAVTDAKLADGISYEKLTGAPTSLPPSGVAGGSLTGTYPDPSLAAGSVGSSEIKNGAVTALKLSPDAFGGSGMASTLARSDHTHIGQVWVGASATTFAVLNTATDGVGIAGSAANGSSASGVSGYSVAGRGVAGSSTTGTGVLASSDSGTGMRGESSNGVAVLGRDRATSNYAELGRSTDAVHAVAFAGRAVFAQSSSGTGVYAESSGDGVYGRSTSGGDGVSGRSDVANKSGVYGFSQGSFGVTGSSSEGTGVSGTTSSNNQTRAGVVAHSNGASPAIRAEGDLVVTAAYRGDLGPNAGAPFPRPAYDSGWISITETPITFDPGLHPPTYSNNNFVIDLMGKIYGIAGNSWVGQHLYYQINTDNTITVFNQPFAVHECRLRVWYYR